MVYAIWALTIFVVISLANTRMHAHMHVPQPHTHPHTVCSAWTELPTSSNIWWRLHLETPDADECGWCAGMTRIWWWWEYGDDENMVMMRVMVIPTQTYTHPHTHIHTLHTWKVKPWHIVLSLQKRLHPSKEIFCAGLTSSPVFMLKVCASARLRSMAAEHCNNSESLFVRE